MSTTLNVVTTNFLDQQTQPLYFDLPRQVVCEISHPQESVYPPEVMTVCYDPKKPNQLNYLSYSVVQKEEERKWHGVIKLCKKHRERLSTFLRTHPQNIQVGLAP